MKDNGLLALQLFSKNSRNLWKAMKKKKFPQVFLRGAKLPMFPHSFGDFLQQPFFGDVCLLSLWWPLSPALILFNKLRSNGPATMMRLPAFHCKWSTATKTIAQPVVGCLVIKRISPVGYATTYFFWLKKGLKEDTGPMSSLARLLFPVVKIGSCDIWFFWVKGSSQCHSKFLKGIVHKVRKSRLVSSDLRLHNARRVKGAQTKRRSQEAEKPRSREKTRSARSRIERSGSKGQPWPYFRGVASA